MRTAMPSAATRVSRPSASPSGPRNSAITARNARGGGKPDFVKDAMVPLKPKPPNHPSVFWAPWGNITTARVSLRMSGTTPPFVATSQSIMTTSTTPPRVSRITALLDGIGRTGVTGPTLRTPHAVGLPSCLARCRLSGREDRGYHRGVVEAGRAVPNRFVEPGAGGARLLQVETRSLGGLDDQPHVLGRVAELEARRIAACLHVGALGANGGSDRGLGQHVEHGGAVETERRRQRKGLAEGNDRGAQRRVDHELHRRSRSRRTDVAHIPE